MVAVAKPTCFQQTKWKARGKVILNNYQADATDEPSVEALFNAVVEDFGRVDVLINNADVTSDALLATISHQFC